VFGIGNRDFHTRARSFPACQRRFGLKVEKFAFGFGREVFGFPRGETRYSINIFPRRIRSRSARRDIDTASGDRGNSFRPPGTKRLIIARAARSLNYLLALFFLRRFSISGDWTVASNQPVIGNHLRQNPAQAAGLQTGRQDSFRSTLSPVKDWEAIPSLISNVAAEAEIWQIERDNSKFFVEVTPRGTPPPEGADRYRAADGSQKMMLVQSFTLSSKFIVFQSYMDS